MEKSHTQSLTHSVTQSLSLFDASGTKVLVLRNYAEAFNENFSTLIFCGGLQNAATVVPQPTLYLDELSVTFNNESLKGITFHRRQLQKKSVEKNDFIFHQQCNGGHK